LPTDSNALRPALVGRAKRQKPNPVQYLELVQTHFSEKIQKCGGASPLTISSFSLTENSFMKSINFKIKKEKALSKNIFCKGLGLGNSSSTL
jgi:hypothetical protein